MHFGAGKTILAKIISFACCAHTGPNLFPPKLRPILGTRVEGGFGYIWVPINKTPPASLPLRILLLFFLPLVRRNYWLGLPKEGESLEREGFASAADEGSS